MIISFNKKIYNKKAILEAIKEFSHLARFELKTEKDYLIVKVEKIDEEVKDILKDEFSNYVFYAMNKT